MTAAVEGACGEVEALIRTNSRTFHFATALLPRVARRAVRALYAFCRTTDDLVDRQRWSQEDLERWKRQVQRPAAEQTEPLLACWARVRERYGVDPRYEGELIDGVGMDIRPRRYATWEDLQDYCYRVASTVGLLSIPIVGLAPGVTFEQAAPYAIKLGIALQLTNILRDVGEDAQAGRVYLPEADLALFHLQRADILQRCDDQRFVGLMRFEIQRARALYQEALPGVALLSAGARLGVGAAALLYRAILGEIEALEYHVYDQRAHTSTLRKVRLLPEIFVQIGCLPSPSDLVGKHDSMSNLSMV